MKESTDSSSYYHNHGAFMSHSLSHWMGGGGEAWRLFPVVERALEDEPLMALTDATKPGGNKMNQQTRWEKLSISGTH